MNELNNNNDKIQNVKEKAQNVGENLRDKAQYISENVKDKAKDFGQEALEKTKYVQEQFADYVRSHPYKSLGLAFIVGALFSRLKNN